MKPCILLIEDDQDMRDLVSGHLEHSGFDVQRADDGIKGQALALQYTPDLILLDLMLPKVDGLTRVSACGATIAPLGFQS